MSGVRPPSSVIRKRAKRKVRQREKRHRRRGGQRVWRFAQSVDAATLVRLHLPKIISIANSIWRRYLLQVCDRLRAAIVNNSQNVVFDFSATEVIEAPAMLYFVAELDRALRMAPKRQTIRCKLPEADSDRAIIVGQVLNQIGLLERIGQPAPEHHVIENFDESVRNWRFATGTRIDERPGDVLDQHEGRIAAALLSKMHVGLSEAIINSLHHAYEGDRRDGCKPFAERRWWMFTREQDGMLEVLVCDLGIGIPRSLPMRWDRKLLGRMRELFSDDGAELAAIKSALVLGESSTQEEHRGKGLPQVWEATTSTDDGRVGIYSGRAYLGSIEGNVTGGQYYGAILGTLVSWRVPVNSAG